MSENRTDIAAEVQVDPIDIDMPRGSSKSQLRKRVEEAGLLYKLSSLLAVHRDLQDLLDAAAQSAAEVMDARGASIRLLSDDGKELIPKAVHNLSETYLNKGHILVADSELYRRTLNGEVVYVEDMRADPRVLYPEFAEREGLVSMLGAPMVYKKRAIGVIRVYTANKRSFSKTQIDLLRAVAHMMAAAIEHSRADEENLENQRVQRQLKLAAAVQRRMMPNKMPHMPPFDIAARYEPSLDLGGDFFDFIYLDGHVGVAVGDVVGKGIAASLLMSSVRSSLRAYAQDLYDIDEVMSRVNAAMTRDTLDNEFATVFFGVIDPHSTSMTYCNAGHEPPILLRNGETHSLDVGGMIVGVDAEQPYDKSILRFEPGDWLVIFTDGLTEAFNYTGEQFGRERIGDALKQVAEANMNAQTALKHILWQKRLFTGLRTSVDDTTIVVIRVTDEQPESPRDIKI